MNDQMGVFTAAYTSELRLLMEKAVEGTMSGREQGDLRELLARISPGALTWDVPTLIRRGRMALGAAALVEQRAMH